MASTATSSMVVDLSGDNDNAGALAAAATIPAASADSPFERSCDNPECSAPKLISLVPKRETSEFITEPVIMNQPTLINGFTTVFQIDGIGARMNDIMYGDQGGNSGPGSSNGTPPKPKSVFRIVPNTHAHIVNYVVVDGAGETMRKIKANDAETMRKLLDSQRLSAEQMLKKLIGKAFKTPTPQVPMPIPAKAQMTSNTAAPVQMSVSGPLPVVPPGITITPIPLPDGLQVSKSIPSSVSSSPTVEIQTPNTSAIATKSATSFVTTLSTSTITTSKPTSSETVASNTIASTATTAIPTVSSPTISTPTASTTTLSTSAASTTPSPTASASTPILRRVLVSKPGNPPKSPVQSPRYGRPNILKRKLSSTPVPEAIKRLRPRSPKQKTPMATGLIPITTASPPPSTKLPTLPKLPTKPPTPTTRHQSQLTTPAKKMGDLVSLPKATIKSTLPESEATDEDKTSTTGTNETLTREPTTLASVKLGALPTPQLLSTEETLPKAPSRVDRSSSKCTETLPVKTKPLMGPASRMNALRAIAAAKGNQATKPELPNKFITAAGSKPPITRIGETLITSTAPLTPKADATAMPKTKPCSVAIEKTDISTNTIIKAGEYLNMEKSASTSKPEAKSSIKIAAGLTSKLETESTPKSASAPDSKVTSQLASKTATSKTKVTTALVSKPETASTSKVTLAPESKVATQSAAKLNAPSPSKKKSTQIKVSAEKDPLAISEETRGATPTSKVNDTATPSKIGESSNAKANTNTTSKSTASKLSVPGVSKVDGVLIPKATSKPDRLLSPKADLIPAAELDATSISKISATQIKTVASKVEPLPPKVTRSSTPKVSATSASKTDRVWAPTNKSVAASSKIGETSTPSATPVSTQSRSLRVVLPTLKSGVMTIPVRSPHPNLKIASVISGGSAVAAATSGADPKSSASKTALDEANGPDIEKLQQELAALRRTVARLTKKKP